MTVRVEITANTAQPALRGALLNMRGEGRRLMLQHMGEYLMRSTRERAALETGPDGKKWKPLSPAYARWKQKKRPGVPMLKFDFHMLGDQLAYDVEGGDLVLGTNAPYGARQHFGGTGTHAAHSRKLAFAKDRPDGRKRFARPGSRKVDHEKWATVGEYTSTTPGRPWLGLSDADADELRQIGMDHVAGMFGAR